MRMEKQTGSDVKLFCEVQNTSCHVGHIPEVQEVGAGLVESC